MRAFQSRDSAGKFTLVEFKRDRLHFWSIEDSRNFPITQQPFGITFIFLFARVCTDLKCFHGKLPPCDLDEQRADRLFLMSAPNCLSEQMRHRECLNLAAALCLR